MGTPIDQQALMPWNSELNDGDLQKSPAFSLFLFVRDYLNENQAKLTAKGNLPAKMVKHIYQEYQEYVAAGLDNPDHRISKVHNENSFQELGKVRQIMQSIGFGRVYKGHFILTKKATETHNVEIFKAMLTDYTEDYNWAYHDGYPESGFFRLSQRCFSFF